MEDFYLLKRINTCVKTIQRAFNKFQGIKFNLKFGYCHLIRFLKTKLLEKYSLRFDDFFYS